MYKLKNYLLDNCSGKSFNYRLANGTLTSLPFTLNLDFGVTLSTYHLCLQSKVFSKEIFTRSNIDLRYVTGSNIPSNQRVLLERAYVYSYAKSLFYGLYFREVVNLPLHSPVFVGHGVFQRMLARSRFRLVKDDFTLNLRISVSNDQKDALFSELVNKFTYLADCEGQDSSGSRCFVNYELDRILTSLCDYANNSVSKRYSMQLDSHFDYSNNKLSDTNRPKVKVVEGEKTNQQSVVSSSSRSDLDAINPGKRMVEIFSLDDPHLDEYILDDSLPLGNSALNVSNANQWYYCFDRDNLIRFSVSHHICRSCFIYLSSVSNNTYYNNNKYMDTLPRNYETDFLIPYDVRSITYLRVDGLVNFSGCSESLDSSSPFVLFKPDGQSPSSK